VSTGLGADRPTGGLATHGLATLFWVDIVPIPEPSTTALLLLCALALGWKFWKVGRVAPRAPPTPRQPNPGALGEARPTQR